MRFDRRLFIAGAAGVLTQGCAHSFRAHPASHFREAPSLIPLMLTEDRLMRITVCTRPFRTAGPRLEAEQVDDKVLVHNYGHGGSGWSLSWGCAAEAAGLARSGGADRFAVVGAGVAGLTTALRLVETGAAVTLYARDFTAETRSARATGVWSPSSRIALEADVSPQFAERWEAWARASYAVHQHYVGTAGAPVEFVRQYALRDDPRPPFTPATRDFLHLDRRLRGMTPAWSSVEPSTHPFNAATARSGLIMTFNVAAYSDRLLRDFLLRGGKIVRRDFPDLAAMLALKEKVIVNCTGFGAKTLMADERLFPVRGQINWLAPQLNARYGIFYNNVTALSRRDGLIVQYTGPNEDFGYGDAAETPDRDEMRQALATLAPLFG